MVEEGQDRSEWAEAIKEGKTLQGLYFLLANRSWGSEKSSQSAALIDIKIAYQLSFAKSDIKKTKSVTYSSQGSHTGQLTG